MPTAHLNVAGISTVSGVAKTGGADRGSNAIHSTYRHLVGSGVISRSTTAKPVALPSATPAATASSQSTTPAPATVSSTPPSTPAIRSISTPATAPSPPERSFSAAASPSAAPPSPPTTMSPSPPSPSPSPAAPSPSNSRPASSSSETLHLPAADLAAEAAYGHQTNTIITTPDFSITAPIVINAVTGDLSLHRRRPLFHDRAFAHPISPSPARRYAHANQRRRHHLHRRNQQRQFHHLHRRNHRPPCSRHNRQHRASGDTNTGTSGDTTADAAVIVPRPPTSSA